MRKILLVISLLMFMAVSVYGESKTKKSDVRDSSGKLLYRTSTSGNKTEFRDSSGKLLMRSKTTGDSTEVRNSSGKLIERIKQTK